MSDKLLNERQVVETNLSSFAGPKWATNSL